MACWESCKSCLYTLGFCLLLFIVVPIKVEKKASLSQNSPVRAKFASYLSQFNKTYSKDSEDYEGRLAAFQDALGTIKSLNSMRKSNHSAEYGLTDFADMTPQEFSHRYLKRHHHKHERHSHRSRENSVHMVSKRAALPNVPLQWDWRNKGVVSSVKDQGPCGACWAFSTVGTVETMAALKTGKLTELSVQEVIDCAQYGNMGCNGGDFCSLLEWLTDFKVSLVPALSYPLVLKDMACQYKKGGTGVLVAANFTCDNFVGNENALLQSVATHGPVIVAVNAITWQFYLGGVIENQCPGDAQLLNHAVEVVGYDLSAPIPHYIVRNSWGKRFGEAGYLRVAIGSNTCGIANEVSSLDVV